MSLFLSERDDGLLRPSVGRDPLGLQPIWTTRARNLIPHLTAQSNRLEGFQVLLTIFGLWPTFKGHIKDETHKQLKNFYLLVEQAIARSAFSINKGWPLPGQRRLKGGSDELVISLNRDYHLAYGQLSSGTWGLYRGAAERAKLLNLQTLQVAEPVERVIAELPLLQPNIRKSLFVTVQKAIDSPKEPFQLPGGNKGALVRALALLAAQPPLKDVLLEPLMRPSRCPLTGELSLRLAKLNQLEGKHRSLLAQFSSELPEHRQTFEQLVDCEQWLAPLEASFEWLCGNGSLSLEEAARKLSVNLADLRAARQAFRSSGRYEGTGNKRHQLYGTIELGSPKDFILSLLDAHRTVSEERGAGPWALLNENGRLEVLVPMEIPDKQALEPSTAWRNDYYLWSLWNLSRQMIGGEREDG